MVRELGGWLMAGFATTVAALGPILLAPAPAHAAAPECFTNGKWIIQAMEDIGGAHWLGSSGTRTDMWVPSGSTSCSRVSSIYVETEDSRNGFEFGWVVGYSSVTGQTYASPKLF